MDTTDWFQRAIRHFRDREISQALVAIDKHLKSRSQQASGLLAKAMILNHLKQYRDSESILSSLEMGSSAPPAVKNVYLREMAEMLTGTGRPEAAADYYQQLVDLHPDETSYYILKGGVLVKAGAFERAKAAFLQATEKQGNPEEAWYNYGLLLRAEQKFHQADSAFVKALEYGTDYPEAAEALADVRGAIRLLEAES